MYVLSCCGKFKTRVGEDHSQAAMYTGTPVDLDGDPRIKHEIHGSFPVCPLMCSPLPPDRRMSKGSCCVKSERSISGGRKREWIFEPTALNAVVSYITKPTGCFPPLLLREHPRLESGWSSELSGRVPEQI